MIRSTISDVIVIIGVEAAIILVVGIALVVLLAAVFTVLAVGVNKYIGNSKRYILISLSINVSTWENHAYMNEIRALYNLRLIIPSLFL